MVQYIDTRLLPASSPPGHPKVIQFGLENHITTRNLNVIDTIATFLYRSRHLATFLNIEKYKFVDIRRVSLTTGKIDFYVERRGRCISCWSSDRGFLEDDPVVSYLMFCMGSNGVWGLTYAHLSLDPPEGHNERTRVRDICRSFAMDIMVEEKWEERGYYKLLCRAEVGEGEKSTARGG